MTAPVVQLKSHPITDAVSEEIRVFCHDSIPQLIEAIEAHGGLEPASISFKIVYKPPGQGAAKLTARANLSIPAGRFEHELTLMHMGGGKYQIELDLI